MIKKTAIYLVPAMILAAVAWLVLRPHEARAVEVGDEAPDFSLPLTASSPDGGNRSLVRLADYRGHVLVLNFWGTWCPPCVAEAPSLERFAEKVKPWGVVVLGASERKDLSPADADEDDPGLADFVSKFHLTYPIARDPVAGVAHRYGTFLFPETYIIDRQGRLAEKIISNIDWDDPRMLAFVRELAQPGRQPSS
ncbi:MAG TPA: TlpA disulfide reductase family protein [Terriglobia bacterium]|nr:TlpA disulfide reductase family protein [Terriglobia bacterium]